VESIGFKDVKESDWFHYDVIKAYNQGLVKGAGNGLYAPQ